MELTTERNGAELTVHLSGELNTSTAPELSALMDKELNGVQTLNMDFADCDYVSSAGLRVLLATFKKMKAAKGDMFLTNVGATFMDVLDITGLANVFEVK